MNPRLIWWGVTARRDHRLQLTAFGARDRLHFDSFCSALAATECPAVGPDCALCTRCLSVFHTQSANRFTVSVCSPDTALLWYTPFTNPNHEEAYDEHGHKTARRINPRVTTSPSR